MRLKDDEVMLLHAIRVGDAGSVRLSSGRRSALQRKFERNGWTRSGSITAAGERTLSRQKRAEVAAGPVAAAEAALELEVPDEEERQSDDDGDIQGSAGQGVVDSTRRSACASD